MLCTHNNLKAIKAGPRIIVPTVNKIFKIIASKLSSSKLVLSLNNRPYLGKTKNNHPRLLLEELPGIVANS